MRRKTQGWVSGLATEQMVEVSLIQIGGAGLRGKRGLILMWKIWCLWDIQVVIRSWSSDEKTSAREEGLGVINMKIVGSGKVFWLLFSLRDWWSEIRASLKELLGKNDKTDKDQEIAGLIGNLRRPSEMCGVLILRVVPAHHRGGLILTPDSHEKPNVCRIFQLGPHCRAHLTDQQCPLTFKLTFYLHTTPYPCLPG